jgi:hypothetical protein
MRTFLKAAAFVAMIAVPAVGFAQTAAPAQKKSASTAAPAQKKASTPATHSTTGVVKSSDDSSLVITKGGKDETFVVNSTTQKQGTVAAGAHVSVHYTMEGKTMTATAVTVQPAKAAKAPKGKK